jgi:hypothetical protein
MRKTANNKEFGNIAGFPFSVLICIYEDLQTLYFKPSEGKLCLNRHSLSVFAAR